MLKPFTIVGMYEDNQQGYADHFEAETAEVAAKMAVAQTSSDLLVIAVYDGHLMSLYHDPLTEG